ncbi:MAG: peptidoglycan-binding protein, partial [Helicobacteraceae bacterium]|nr:peptidoglycan-binding protein [Helicobacteraceae bacterium]
MGQEAEQKIEQGKFYANIIYAQTVKVIHITLLHHTWKRNDKLKAIAVKDDKTTVFKKDDKDNDNACVKLIKENLATLKVLNKRYVLMGGYDDKTEKAVKLFQKEYKVEDSDGKAKLHTFERALKETGEVDRNTLLAIDEALENKWKHKGLIHDSWSDNEKLSAIAKGAITISYNVKSENDDNIKLIQANLQKLGLLKGAKLDTDFGKITEANVKGFQRYYDPDKVQTIQDYDRKEWKKPARQNGIVDQQTLLAMDEALLEGW